MSFALTTRQVRRKTKRVTRRLGWHHLRVGELIQPVVKGMGLKKGESPKRIGGAIEVLSIRRERLDAMVTTRNGYGDIECELEGFPTMTPAEFVAMFCEHNGCTPQTVVTRIGFRYHQP